MDVVTRASELRGKRATFPSPVGFVPTMGALHAGHGALIKRARAECASVIASVFVNPLQFGPKEDFTAYPRSFDGDREMLERLGVDLVFRPDVAEMYPHPLDVVVEPSGVAEDFEGARRPGHFRGVATVVLKLFHMIGPDRAYFGEKDAQQLAVIRRMVADLDLALEIVGCPTQREADGLALSSRNAYLSAEERRAAPHLNAALRVVVAELEKGSRDIPGAIAHARQLLAPLREDYLAVVRPEEFRPLEVAPRGAELLAIGAAFAGQTRLIDNVKVHPFGEGESDARKTR